MGTVPIQAPVQGPSPDPAPGPVSPVTPPPAPANRAPTVSGTPPTTVTAGSTYSFTPTATDADGDALVWSISGRPPGSDFSFANGTLTWTPDEPGTWPDIRITVTDSNGAATSLAAFSIVVSPAAVSGSAALSWTPPARYTDGTALPPSDLTGFVIYSGTNANSLQRVAEVDGRTTSFMVGNLAPGTHYFAVTAIAAGGVESTFSAVGQKTIATL